MKTSSVIRRRFFLKQAAGLGIQGTGNMRTFLGNPEVRLVAVCDVHEAQRLQGKQVVDAFYGRTDCAAYRDFRELMARPDIDAVQITAPDHWHPLMAVEAARRGKHMCCEKPMGWSVRAAQGVRRVIQEKGVVFQFGTQQRSGILFLGSEGWVHVDCQGWDAAPKSLLELKPGPNDVRLYPSDNHHRNFVDAIQGRARPAAPVDVAARTEALCQLQLIAAKLRRKLRWDPVKEDFDGDAEATALLDRPMRAPWGMRTNLRLQTRN